MEKEEMIKDLTMALIYLTRHNDNGSEYRFQEIAEKEYRNDILESLEKEGCIVRPQNRQKDQKFVFLSEKGREEARNILEKLGLEDPDLHSRFEFRTIRPEEAEQAAQIEEICFPPHEACSRKMMLERVERVPDLFLAAVDCKTGKIAGFINGIATDQYEFQDAFFSDPSLHDPSGSVVMVLGLDVLPAYRGQGLARELVYEYCRREAEKGRNLMVLTCHQDKVKMYRKMGFQDRGISESKWGNETWHEMTCFLNI